MATRRVYQAAVERADHSALPRPIQRTKSGTSCMTATCRGTRTWWVTTSQRNSRSAILDATVSGPTHHRRKINSPSMDTAIATRDTSVSFRIKLDSDYLLTDEGLVRIDWDKRKREARLEGRQSHLGRNVVRTQCRRQHTHQVQGFSSARRIACESWTCDGNEQETFRSARRTARRLSAPMDTTSRRKGPGLEFRERQ